MHEIVHFRTREMGSFRIVWDVLSGIPMMTPSIFYESLADDHNAQPCGTNHDGAYLLLGHGTLKDVWLFFAQVFIQPILVILPFLLAAVIFVHPKLRRWVLERASSFVIDFRYRRLIIGRAVAVMSNVRRCLCVQIGILPMYDRSLEGWLLSPVHFCFLFD
jgi:hypothetical protein